MPHHRKDYKVPRDASLVDQELHRKLEEENIRSSGERKDDRKRKGRRDSLADVLLDNILVVDISSSSGLSGGTFVKWRDGRHVFYTGLYNLAVRIQPFSEVLKMRNREDSKEPYRRKRALLLSAHSDSANSSPGASDDAAMVATILEVARNAVYRHLDSSEKLLISSRQRDNEGDKQAKGDTMDNKENSTRLPWLLEVPLVVDINGNKNNDAQQSSSGPVSSARVVLTNRSVYSVGPCSCDEKGRLERVTRPIGETGCKERENLSLDE